MVAEVILLVADTVFAYRVATVAEVILAVEAARFPVREVPYRVPTVAEVILLVVETVFATTELP